MPLLRSFLTKMIFWWLWDKAINFCHLDKKIPVLNYHSTGIFMLYFYYTQDTQANLFRRPSVIKYIIADTITIVAPVAVSR